MTRDYRLGTISGVHLSYEPLAIAGSIALLVLLGIVAVVVLDLPLGAALAGAFIAVVLHWISVVVHNFGHAWAARRVGYPMTGIRVGRLTLLATCLYPVNEPRLPARVHISRALGGPLISLVVSLIAAGIALALRDACPLLWGLGMFFFIDNFVFLTLGAFAPLGFTDGNTLLEWWGKP